MKRTFWLIPIVIFGLFLLACSEVAPALEPPDRQAGKTAVVPVC